MEIRRRKFIVSLIAFMLWISGCSDYSGVSDLQIINERDEKVSVELRAVDLNEKTELLNETFYLGPSEKKLVDEIVNGKEARISVSINGLEASTHDWSDGSSDESGLVVYIYSEYIEFKEIVR